MVLNSTSFFLFLSCRSSSFLQLFLGLALGRYGSRGAGEAPAPSPGDSVAVSPTFPIFGGSASPIIPIGNTHRQLLDMTLPRRPGPRARPVHPGLTNP